MTHPPAPSVPPLDERGWSLVEEREDVRFELPAMRAVTHTLVYDDEALSERVHEATGIDYTWRFFFASRLEFQPPLPPLVGNASVYSTVQAGARSAFVEDLQHRGIEAIERGRTERTRTDTGDRVSLTRYRGRCRLDTAGESVQIPVAGLLGVWTHDGDFRLAGGLYPEQSLATTLDGAPATDPNRFRDELVELVRGTR